MKQGQPKSLIILAIVSLAVILLIVANGIINGKYSFFFKKNHGSVVLGISEKLQLSKFSAESLEKVLEGQVDRAKGELSEKAVETEKNIKSTLEKELSEFTSSQIKSIKLNICRDWGVVPVASVTGSEKQ